jgi:hypothetical protein
MFVFLKGIAKKLSPDGYECHDTGETSLYTLIFKC